MKQFDYIIRDEIGIHARPAGLLVKEVKKYGSKVTIGKDGRTVDGTKLMAIMGLGVKNGNTVTVTVEGADENEACEALKVFFESNL